MPLQRAPMIWDGGVGILKQPTRSKVRRRIEVVNDSVFMVFFGNSRDSLGNFLRVFHPLFRVGAVDDLLDFYLG